MKIEHNALVARIASNEEYSNSLRRYSPAIDAQDDERFNVIDRMRMQTIAVVYGRVNDLLKNLSDDEQDEVFGAAFDLVERRKSDRVAQIKRLNRLVPCMN